MTRTQIFLVLAIFSACQLPSVRGCAVNVTVQGGPVISVSESQTVLTLSFVRTGNTSIIADVNATTSPGSAKSGSDFNSSSVQVHFAINEALVQVNFTIVNNVYLENITETFFITMTTNDPNVCVPLEGVTVRIAEDDKVTVSFHTAFRVFNESDGNVSFTFFKSPNEIARIPITVRYFTAGIGNATLNTDYSNISSQVLFRREEYSRPGPELLTLIDNKVVEDTKCLNVSMATDNPNVLLTPQQTMICILNDDKVVMEFEHTNLTVNEEQGYISIPIIKTGNATIPITVRLTMNEQAFHTAEKNVDYKDRHGDTLTFTKDETRKIVNVSIINDDLPESTEVLSIGMEVLDSSTSIIGPANMVVIRITDVPDNDFHTKVLKQREEDQKQRTFVMTVLFYVILAVLFVCVFIFVIVIVVITHKFKKYASNY